MENAKSLGITLMSITDHDSVSGIAEGAAAVKELDVVFIPGIESA